MSDTYTTIAGDTWDSIAYKVWGNEMYMDTLIKANLGHKDTFMFSAGVTLTLPEITAEVSKTLPPWKRGG